MIDSDPLLPPPAFIERLRTEGGRRYHHMHRFHVLMHEGRLSEDQLRQWVLNRYYYQTRIPIKDALILAKSEDPAFRRAWIRRIRDHDGDDVWEGGLALWRRLAVGVGLDEERVASCRDVLPGVRYACDAYVSFVRHATLVEAVASSLTEMFAPQLIAERIAAWETYYPWVDRAALSYFRSRLSQAPRDAGDALAFVVEQAKTAELQSRCVEAMIRKTEILWHILDAITDAYVDKSDFCPEPTQPSEIGC